MTATVTPPHTTPKVAKYMIDMAKYLNGDTKLPYDNAPEPLGSSCGLDRPLANKIAKDMHAAFVAAGVTPRDVCREMRPCDEARVRNAYENRGLNGDPE